MVEQYKKAIITMIGQMNDETALKWIYSYLFTILG